MATYRSNIYGVTIRPEDASGGRVVTAAGCLTIPTGRVIATGDVLKLFKVGAGGHVRSIWFQNTDFGTDAPGKFGHYGVDDGVAIDDNSIVDSDVVLETAADRCFENLATAVQTSGTAFYAPFATLTEDASFEIVVGTVSAGAAGSIRFAVDVVFFGTNTPYAYDWNGEAALGAVST